MIGDFVQRYMVTSSIQVLFLVASGVGFSCLILTRRAPWAAIGLAGLSAFALWQWELSPIISSLNRTAGDGSMNELWEVLNKLHPTVYSWLWDLLTVAFLLGSITFWPFSYDALSETPKSSEA